MPTLLLTKDEIMPIVVDLPYSEVYALQRDNAVFVDFGEVLN
jgi:hypothetical protein